MGGKKQITTILSYIPIYRFKGVVTMSLAKQDYFHLLPKEIKWTLFSFFTPKELYRFSNSTINKTLNASCTEYTESCLKLEHEKIKATRETFIKLAGEREQHFVHFHMIDTYDKFKAFLSLNPNYLMTSCEDNMVLIQSVNIMLVASGATLSLQHLMHEDNYKIRQFYKESKLTGIFDSYDQWFWGYVCKIREDAVCFGQFEILKSFFPHVLFSSMLQAVFFRVICTAYSSVPLIDSGLDSDSEESVQQIVGFSKIQQFLLELLKNNYDHYKNLIQLLITNGVTLDSDEDHLHIPNYLPSKQLKRWYKEHEYGIPESIIELFALIPEPEKKNFAVFRVT